jgi:hypothetical protein
MPLVRIWPRLVTTPARGASSCRVLTGLAPVQMPAWHVSVRVQALPSLHVLPFGFTGFEHVPVAGSQMPAS